MNKRTIIFRADGSPTIGMGHFIRTLALAEMLNKHFHCIYATRRPTSYQINEIEKVCHERIDLPKDDSHFEYFLSLLTGNEIVVLDNYYFDTDYQHSIKAKGCKLVCIDDMHDKHYVADVVINHAEGIGHEAFSMDSGTKLLSGYKYALIRKEFREQNQIPCKNKYSCMVMMGGADPLGITNKIIHSLQQIEFDKPIAVVNGIAKKNNPVQVGDKFRFFDKLNAKEISQLMMESDFGILPASTVAIEACAVRLPFICGYFVDNQKEIYKGIKKRQLALCIGEFNYTEDSVWVSFVQQISQAKTQRILRLAQKEVLDKEMSNRYIKIFYQLSC
ncbi:MAG: UDP-2,4-diacetamido-2,4,6-trideoxy-beta-L-altropyranose hydrolase [Bacteroidetes bacterium GWF2_42_66]|nr:MAG: UDP-2,4-diacetamido-2,4,6-trideoxy-beta-L-altropyranose hydrolase [Bacteroidetes bacterium GWA2_42_15]OFX96328.1 MAG: UDP-2,4-diacetamido-2,4,6-trideoxy-beta-L-altropyranose hydrolase [Bacteroidetes bacterium GWE2_42_39]OFY46367.1 MAG: UDP-2,4-diacetamido-2,4,6-trideoxy-beta-L-altropyranose hydrolase [Bacteroidetes bacterium GWF2_42_66]HAZ03490.1 UDP-2,4-diacetamido-2,4,6-trideoxy-beta-L-altropyranose hydrolase [Marinilabiliales bacterium]HBL78246.1 UDP-2,4-diacetamido-2,4,6-trideoxy-be